MGEEDKEPRPGKRLPVREFPVAPPEEEVVRLDPSGYRKTKDVERLTVDPLAPVLPGMGDGPVDRRAEEKAILEPEESWMREDRSRFRIPIGWIVLLAAIFLGWLLWALIRIPGGEEDLERRSAEVEQRLEEERHTVEDAARLDKQIETAMRSYIEARTVEEKVRHVRMPERVRPLMEDYYRTHPLVPKRSAGFYRFEAVAVDNYPFLLGKVELEGGGEKVLLLEDTGEGVLVDWESDVAHQPMPLDEYVRRKPLEPVVFRLNAAYDDFYAFRFADQGRYQSFFLSQRDEPEFLFGYAARDSQAYRDLTRMLGELPPDGGKGDKVAAVMVRVRYPEGGRGPRSVLIEEVVSPGWAMVAPEAGEGR